MIRIRLWLLSAPDPAANQDMDLQNWFLLSYFHALIKKENQIYLIYKEIQSGAVAKSYLRKGFLIYEEMRKYFPIYEEAVSHNDFATAPFWIALHMRKPLIFFYQLV